MGLQLSRVAGSLPLCIRMVVDSFQEGGIFQFILHVLRMPAIRDPVGSSLFHEEYCSLSGPGAELCLVCFSVFNTSSLVMGESMGSEGRVFCHRWVGGGSMIKGVSAGESLVRKKLVTSVMGTEHLMAGGDFPMMSMQCFGFFR